MGWTRKRWISGFRTAQPHWQQHGEKCKSRYVISPAIVTATDHNTIEEIDSEWRTNAKEEYE